MGMTMKLHINISPDERYARFIIGLGLFLNIFSLEPRAPVIFLLAASGAVLWISVWTGNSLLYHLLRNRKAAGKKKNQNPAAK